VLDSSALSNAGRAIKDRICFVLAEWFAFPGRRGHGKPFRLGQEWRALVQLGVQGSSETESPLDGVTAFLAPVRVGLALASIFLDLLQAATRFVFFVMDLVRFVAFPRFCFARRVVARLVRLTM
jgi:hypothetical protein